MLTRFFGRLHSNVRIILLPKNIYNSNNLTEHGHQISAAIRSKPLQYKYEQINCVSKSAARSSHAPRLHFDPSGFLLDLSTSCPSKRHSTIFLEEPHPEAYAEKFQEIRSKQEAEVERLESGDLLHLYLPSNRVDVHSDDRIKKRRCGFYPACGCQNYLAQGDHWKNKKRRRCRRGRTSWNWR